MACDLLLVESPPYGKEKSTVDARAYWQNDPVFIEVGAKHTELAKCLLRDGFSKYLGVVRNADLARKLQAANPHLDGDLAYSPDPQVVRRNNAEVLVLTGPATLHLWRYRSVRHAQHVAWQATASIWSFVGLLACCWHLLTRRYIEPRLVAFHTPSGGKRHYFSAKIRRRRPCGQNSLHFLPHRLGVAGFFAKLDELDVRYAVLRWFESLPHIEPGEDIDLLVADECLPTLLETLDSLPGIQSCDIYSEHALARSDYCGVPYFAPRVAQRVLARAVRHNNLCWVPSREDHFHSLAYHAVYHKGAKSHLPSGGAPLKPKRKPEHDYTTILQQMASELGLEIEISLEGLHAYLQQIDWAPAPEELARLAIACRRNKWLQRLAERQPAYVHDEGIAVFAIREQAVARGYTDRIVQMIADSGFDIVSVTNLSALMRVQGGARTRGGTWAMKGPFATSGGLPAAVVIAHDPEPLAPSAQQRKQFKERTNARVYVKESIRDALLAELSPAEGFNALHSSDHAPEAWHLIEELVPEQREPTMNYLNDRPNNLIHRSRRAA